MLAGANERTRANREAVNREVKKAQVAMQEEIDTMRREFTEELAAAKAAKAESAMEIELLRQEIHLTPI